MTTHNDDKKSAVSAHDDVAVAVPEGEPVDELGRLAQLIAAGFGDRRSDTGHGH